jgi:hypothetical protein
MWALGCLFRNSSRFLICDHVPASGPKVPMRAGKALRWGRAAQPAEHVVRRTAVRSARAAGSGTADERLAPGLSPSAGTRSSELGCDGGGAEQGDSGNGAPLEYGRQTTRHDDDKVHRR